MVCYPDGLTRRAQGGRLGVLQRDLLQLHATGRQVIAGVCGAPLDERGQAAVHQAQAVFAHGDLPLQQAIRRGAAGGDGCATLNAQCCQRGMAGGHIRHAGYPVDELRPVLRHLLLQRFIIHIKPASSARW